MINIEKIVMVDEKNIETELYEIYHMKSFGPGGLRAPCVLACAMRSLAIVITIVQSFFLSLSPLFLRFLLLTQFGESPMCEITSPKSFWHN